MTARGHDTRTLSFYAGEAAAYAAASAKSGPSSALVRFMALLPAAADVLDLGCGTGRDTLALHEAGFNVTPIDGSPEMARELTARSSLKVEVLLFENLDRKAEFDGVWANASLLHVPREAIVEVLTRINRALKPGGLFYASFKAGTGGGRDGFERYYNYPARAELEAWMEQSGGWISLRIEEKKGGGYDAKPTDWLHLYAEKRKNG
ncbi:MAG: class I SAM-dependent methyltransferase [Parvibaculum sp.]|uniref:class I SAM-dependent methyltransferase n=1 Tax=Parvibaculum sp. TaxID=2024848 RepID=UPI0025F1D5ED|nr:class I SAM-dependent methyltransferase [Parvibaculum sp.]MCE9650708.1 class I SAM-dependent methyltransferase [Parvibaculum sp.]